MTSKTSGGSWSGRPATNWDGRERVIWISLDPSQVSQGTSFVQEVAQIAEFTDLLMLRDPGRFVVQGFGENFPKAVQQLAVMLGLRFRIERVEIVEADLKG